MSYGTCVSGLMYEMATTVYKVNNDFVWPAIIGNMLLLIKTIEDIMTLLYYYATKLFIFSLIRFVSFSGLTDQWLHGRIDDTKYKFEAGVYKDEVQRFNVALSSTGNGANSSSSRRDIILAANDHIEVIEEYPQRFPPPRFFFCWLLHPPAYI